MSNELIPIETLKPLEVFQPEKVDDLLNRIKEQARTFAADASTEAGRKEISSFCYQIRRSKTALDGMGKDLVSDWKKQAATVDAERKKIREELDELVQEIYAPVQEFKDREERRIKDHEEALETLASYKNVSYDTPSADIQAQLDQSKELFNDRDWQEFEGKAQDQHAANIESLKLSLEARTKYEAEQAELERLRKEEEQRKKKEEEDRIAREAAEKARQEAEERGKKEAEEAAQKERDRIAAEKKAEEEEAAKREANKRHKGKINREARDDIMLALGDGYSESDAEKIVTAIAQGKIRNVKIFY